MLAGMLDCCLACAMHSSCQAATQCTTTPCAGAAAGRLPNQEIQTAQTTTAFLKKKRGYTVCSSDYVATDT